MEATTDTPKGENYIKLRAINPDRNVDRVYEILFQRGLFNSYLVIIGYGRYGKNGRTKTYVFGDEPQAKKFITKTLKKRLNAQARIGCNYFYADSL